MGYTPINKAEIERVFRPERVIVARVYCDELQEWHQQEFPFANSVERTSDGTRSCAAMTAALAWVEKQLNQLSM